MKLNRILGLAAVTSFAATMAIAGTSNMDFAKVFEKECQGCHGPIHQGGVGSDLRPKALKKKNAEMLAETIMEGRENTAMPAWNATFSKDDAAGMVHWLMDWKNTVELKLDFDQVHKTWTKLADRDALAKKYPKATDVKDVKDITFATERDASLVDFIDSTTGKVLSRHKAGFAVHVTVTNKHDPRYAYCISRSGKLTMFDIAAPGQPALATVQVGQESRGLAVSPDGKYVMAGNYNPGGAVLCDAHTLEPLKVYDTSRVIDTDGQIGPSRVAYIADTPYGPYFSFALKDAGHVYVVDYSKPDFPIVGDIPNIGKVLHDAFLNENEGEDFGRYVQVASQGSDLMGIVDQKTMQLAAKVHTGKKSKPHPGQGSSWFNKKMGKQLNATNSMNFGSVVIWESPSWKIVKKIKTSGGGLFVGTGEHTPWIWSDCVLGKPDKYNEVHLINKETLETDRIIKVGKTEGQLIDAKSGKVLQTWDATQHEKVPMNEKTFGKEKIMPMPDHLGKALKEGVQPRLLHAEPANHGKWTMISEWTTGRIGIYESETGKFVKYINNLTTPTFTYSVEHRQHIPGA
ncbi:nitrite reductase [Sulfurovum sp. NBC37-1]|uniref:nitrite reductase n=1 Tax=Sulfurovum sp. (strain NBC37-1) TaxID=387093 RepID=UPI0001587591|nr:nitrite reductase [Sulfurovum sp. NBC37-1]BAF71205.1 cytochrome cd1 nitrite reductase [Sulfurovum sp. NBC37-1]